MSHVGTQEFSLKIFFSIMTPEEDLYSLLVKVIVEKLMKAKNRSRAENDDLATIVTSSDFSVSETSLIRFRNRKTSHLSLIKQYGNLGVVLHFFGILKLVLNKHLALKNPLKCRLQWLYILSLNDLLNLRSKWVCCVETIKYKLA